MKHIYNVTGMTCNGCKSSVEEALSALPSVENVLVDLEAHTATLKMKAHVDLTTLQSVLSDKFKISERIQVNTFSKTEIQNQSELKQLFPLILILGYLVIASVLLNRTPFNLEGFMLSFMGLFYIVFSFFKLLDLKGFSESFKMYDPLTKAIPAYGWVYPFIEVALALMFLMRFHVNIALIITVVVLGITTFGVTKTLLNKTTIQCACLGTALKLPMTKATFIENTIMIIMALVMLSKTMSL
ncbi:MauE/DoxX family redox-associated membrane protein [uncultured Winogradskyella sp.]|uniref:heavy-metal-associated domain-containing protein n=1 Tax=uncultured Winogradskyella sp. TaxID=395353 RepID=UPI0030D857B8|tara:strand:+ start:105881 stop:106606 length:726 start_codon:yes stop_codon:yes gene_type:complete